MESNLASPARRITASFIDGLLVVVLLSQTILHPNVFPGLINIQAFIVIAALVAYEALFIYFCGWTLGKLILGIRIVDLSTHERPSLAQSFLRPWAKLLFGLWVINREFIYLITLLLSAFNLLRMLTDDAHLSVHDRIAGTAAFRLVKQTEESIG
ncbi:MAG: RDD family protein [Firmicutes bacterium]|nr:RDD family protein [Bacillota bacterium]